METIDALVNPIRNSPLLMDALEVLQREAAEEQKRREQFYAELTPSQKAEFISGEVVFHSPAKDRHLVATNCVMALLNAHVIKHGLGAVRTEKCLCVFPRNDYEPDVVFFGCEKAEALGAETMKYPVPDFVVEVLSPSTEKMDRGVKFVDFAANGVGEYWIVDAEKMTVEQYVISSAGEAYELKCKVDAGTLRSVVVEGFEVPVAALFDEVENLNALQIILSA